jgi:predicted transcriptional regulator
MESVNEVNHENREGGFNMQSVSTRLPEEWAKALEEIAKQEHTTRSQLIRDMLLSFAREYQDEPRQTMDTYLEGRPQDPEQIDIMEEI